MHESASAQIELLTDELRQLVGRDADNRRARVIHLLVLTKVRILE